MFKLCLLIYLLGSFSFLISQGKIGQLVTSKPIERKSILEEGAGISGIHARRQEAETRLNAASSIQEADELKKQQQKQLDNLKKQAEETQDIKKSPKKLKKLTQEYVI